MKYIPTERKKKTVEIKINKTGFFRIKANNIKRVLIFDSSERMILRQHDFMYYFS